MFLAYNDPSTYEFGQSAVSANITVLNGELAQNGHYIDRSAAAIGWARRHEQESIDNKVEYGTQIFKAGSSGYFSYSEQTYVGSANNVDIPYVSGEVATVHTHATMGDLSREMNGHQAAMTSGVTYFWSRPDGSIYKMWYNGRVDVFGNPYVGTAQVCPHCALPSMDSANG